MPIRMRALILFALATPVAAIAASRLRPHPHPSIALPNPPIVVVDRDLQDAGVPPSHPIATSTPPIRPPQTAPDAQDDFTIDGLAVDPDGHPIPYARLVARD